MLVRFSYWWSKVCVVSFFCDQGYSLAIVSRGIWYSIASRSLALARVQHIGYVSWERGFYALNLRLVLYYRDDSALALYLPWAVLYVFYCLQFVCSNCFWCFLRYCLSICAYINVEYLFHFAFLLLYCSTIRESFSVCYLWYSYELCKLFKDFARRVP